MQAQIFDDQYQLINEVRCWNHHGIWIVVVDGKEKYLHGDKTFSYYYDGDTFLEIEIRVLDQSEKKISIIKLIPDEGKDSLNDDIDSDCEYFTSHSRYEVKFLLVGNNIFEC